MNQMAPGGAWRIKGPYELGRPEVEDVSEALAARCIFLRFQYLDNECCAMFQDPLTYEVYGQPCEDRLGYFNPTIFSGARREASNPRYLYLAEVGTPHAKTAKADSGGAGAEAVVDEGPQPWEV